MDKETEKKVIQQLTNYRDILGRLKVLENYSVGVGITISRLSDDDHLQQLHKQLKGVPSYMYLTKRELQLEQVATSHLERYPAGLKSQYSEVRDLHSDDDQREKMLRELQRKIKKVVEARTGTAEGIDGVIERMSEYQDLQVERDRVDAVLNVMREHNSNLAALLLFRYVEGYPVNEVATSISVGLRTYKRWHEKAITEYGKLSGIIDVRLVAQSWRNIQD